MTSSRTWCRGLTNFAHDLATNDVANYTWLVPDLTHDGHDPQDDTKTALHNADVYLSQQLPALLQSKYFQPGGDGVLLVTFDESDLDGDDSCSKTQKNWLRRPYFLCSDRPRCEAGISIVDAPDAERHAARNLRHAWYLILPRRRRVGVRLAEFFNDVTVKILTSLRLLPRCGSLHKSVRYCQKHRRSLSTAWAVYVDGVLYQKYTGSSSLQAWVPTPLGLHAIGVNAWDNKGGVGVNVVHVTRTY